MTRSTIKAAVCTRYGSPDYLQVREVDIPAPGDKDVLVKVVATTVTKADTMMRKAEPFISRFFLGFLRPKKAVMGTGFSGIVQSVGKEVKQFRPGDEVFGETGVDFGANAAFLRIPESGVILHKPSTLGFAEASTLTDGPLTSYNFLKELGQLTAGKSVLINGASGSLGTAAVQMAKYYGAHVTGVCSAGNRNLVKQLGADEVIDYTTTHPLLEPGSYDLIFDTVGVFTFSSAKKVLKENGIYLSPVLNLGLLIQMMRTALTGGKKAVFSATGLQPPDSLRAFLKNILLLTGNGDLKIVIDRTYPLEQIADAHRYVDQGHKKGNVVISL